MNRTNLTLLVVFAAIAGVYLLTGPESSVEEISGPGPRLFPEFNPEAADLIVVKGGWMKSRWVMERMEGDWKLTSVGGFPLKKQAALDFLDAVHNLRAEKIAGATKELQREVRLDERARQVAIYRNGVKEPMAAFRVGKSPQNTYEEVFLRKEGDDTVYRTRTVLSKDQGRAYDPDSPWSRPSAFAWDNYVQKLGTQWVDTAIWNLSDVEVVEIELRRKDEEPIRIRKGGEDRWEIVEPEEAPADVDAVTSITSPLTNLRLRGVVGKHAEVGEQHGLGDPIVTLVMTVKKKVEPEKPSGEPTAGEEEGEPEGTGTGKDEEKPKEKEKEKEKAPEYVLVKHIVVVAAETSLPDRYDDEDGVEESVFHPIVVRREPRDPEEGWKEDFIYLVDDYSVAPLLKKLSALRQEPEKKPEEGAGGEKAGGSPGGEGSEEKADEAAGGGEGCGGEGCGGEGCGGDGCGGDGCGGEGC
ncbi:MAG: DUF4340 domain-containing protein, partial [Planctomycetota bacterium]